MAPRVVLKPRARLLDAQGFQWSQWELLRDYGLRGTCRVELLHDLLAVVIEPDLDQPELRAAARRGFPLHVSLTFKGEGRAVDVEALKQRWDGRRHTFRFARVGWGGGAELAADDALLSDPAAQRLKGAGLYRGRVFHISL